MRLVDELRAWILAERPDDADQPEEPGLSYLDGRRDTFDDLEYKLDQLEREDE